MKYYLKFKEQKNMIKSYINSNMFRVIFPLFFCVFKHGIFCPIDLRNSSPITCYDFLVFALVLLSIHFLRVS